MNLLHTKLIHRCKAFMLIIITLLFSTATFAQSNKNSLLWKIEGKDLTQPSYLFGTIHMICEDQFVMPQKVERAIKQTEQSYLEINLDAPDFAQQSQKFMMSDQLLSEQLSAKDYQILDSIIAVKLKTNLKQLDKIKPMIIVAGLMQASFTCKVISFESEIIKLTKANNKTIDGLSTVEEQFSFLDKIFDTKDMMPYLKTFNDQDINKMFSSIHQAYSAEHIEAIDQLLLEFSTTNPEGYLQLLPVRNQLWAKKMPAIMKDKPTFFGVGCGHLLGKLGLVELLTQQGYKVSPVFN